MPELPEVESLVTFLKERAVGRVIARVDVPGIHVLKTYDLGANSFITKPVGLESMTRIVEVLGQYWFQIVELPVPHEPA